MEEDQVEPVVEFEADVFEVADLGETGLAVEFETLRLVGGDQGDDLAMAEGLGAGEEVGEEGAAEALTKHVVADIDRIFNGEAVGGAGVEGAQGGPGEDVVGGGGGDGDWMPGSVCVEPRSAFVGGGGGVLISGGRGVDVVIVNGVDGGQVGIGGETDLE